ELYPLLQQITQIFARALLHQRHHDRGTLHMMKSRHETVIIRIHPSRPVSPARPIFCRALHLLPSRSTGGSIPVLLRCRTHLSFFVVFTPALLTMHDLFCHSRSTPCRNMLSRTVRDNGQSLLQAHATRGLHQHYVSAP